MGSGFLCEFRSGTDLEIVVGVNVSNDSAFVKVSGSFGEVFFHHVQKLRVLLLVDSGILDDQAAVFVKWLSNGFTLLGWGLSFEEGLNVDDRDFEVGKSEGDLFEGSLQHCKSDDWINELIIIVTKR